MRIYMNAVLLLILSLCSPFGAADENVLPVTESIDNHSQQRPDFVFSLLPELGREKHQLPWPVSARSEDIVVGNLMAQFQSYYYGYQYFHGGVDILANIGDPIITPVSGRIEAGFYGYLRDKDGYFNKMWIPYGEHQGKEEARADYFEVAVIDEYGYRYEFHHVDSENLPEVVLEKLRSGQPVEAGSVVGFVKGFHSKVKGADYHHIHYNVVSPGGVRMNPEWLSELLDDSIAPSLVGLFAKHPDGSYREVQPGQRLNFLPAGFLVNAFDQKDDQFYIHQPHFMALEYEGRQVFAWDFEYALWQPNDERPKIFDFFQEKFKLQEQTIYTEGDYDKFNFFNRLDPPLLGPGRVVVKIRDLSGNSAEIQFSISEN